MNVDQIAEQVFERWIQPDDGGSYDAEDRIQNIANVSVAISRAVRGAALLAVECCARRAEVHQPVREVHCSFDSAKAEIAAALRAEASELIEALATDSYDLEPPKRTTP